MARFQVFIPKSKEVPLNDLQPQQPLEAVGLADMIANAAGQNSAGPEDQTGILISWPNAPGSAETGYKPDRQTWIPAVPREGLEAKRYWVGIWNDKPPTEKDLLRQYPYTGRHVELNDGKQWLIPTIGELPNEMILADDGTFKFVVQRQYHQIHTEAYKWADKFGKEGPEGEFAWNDLALYVLKILSLNYMITPEIVGHMRLFGQAKLLESLLIACGGNGGGK